MTILPVSSSITRRNGDVNKTSLGNFSNKSSLPGQGTSLLLNAALDALKLGFSVIPAKKDKSPAVGSWKRFQEQPMSPEEACRLFQSTERLAIVCGKVSGNLECLDIDDQDLVQPYAELLEVRMPGLFPKLLQRRTPNGFHLLYRCEAPIRGNTKLAFDKQNKIRLETRGEGGYCLSWPSSGYAIIAGQLDACAVLSVNEVSILHQIAKVFDERNLTDSPPNGGNFSEVVGAQFNQSHSCGDILTAHGWRVSKRTTAGIGYTRPGKDQGISGVLLKTGNFYVWSSNAAPLEPGKSYSPFALFTAYEHGGVFKQAAKALAANEHGKQPQWLYPQPLLPRYAAGQKYNMDHLPVAIARAAREVARFAKVPAASPAIIGLACVATAIGKKAVIVEREGLEHQPALFLCLVAASGERKTQSFANMTKPLEDWTAQQRVYYEELYRKAKATNETLDAALSGLTAQAKKEHADLEKIKEEKIALEEKKVPLPVFPSLFTTDTTEERLFQKMHDRNGAYAVMSGEGRQIFDAIMGKYSGEGRTGDGIYLAGTSGDTMTRDRVGGDQGPEERVIRYPCLNVCVMVQPDKYLDAARVKALRDSGALARIWPVYLPSLVGSRLEEKDEADLNLPALVPYSNLIQSILDTRPRMDTQGGTSCHKVVLSGMAKEARREFHNAIEILMRQDQEYADVPDIASKAVTQTTKLALILHVANDAAILETELSILPIETWAKAQALGTYHLQEAVRIQRMADEGQELEHASRLLRWLQQEKRKEVTATFVSQLGPRPRLKVEKVKQVLEILAELGYLRPEERTGNRVPVYIVNPLWLDSQNSRNSRGRGGG